MGRGSRGSDGWPDAGGQGSEWVRPLPRDDAPGDASDRPPPRGGDRDRSPRQFEPAYDYDRGFAGWGDRTEPGMRSGRGRNPRYRESRGLLPDSLPVVPTLLVTLVAIILAFLLGRSTGGGDDTAASPNVKTAQSTTTVSSAPITHTVQRNETLSGIASQYGVTSEELAAANNINNANHVFVGQKLTIPATDAVTATTTTTRVPG